MAVRKTGRVGGRGFGGKQAGIGSQVPGHPRHRRFADKSAPPGYLAADLAQSWLKAIVRSAAIAGASRVSIWLRCNMYTSLPSRRIPMEGDDGGYPVTYARARSGATPS